MSDIVAPNGVSNFAPAANAPTPRAMIETSYQKAVSQAADRGVSASQIVITLKDRTGQTLGRFPSPDKIPEALVNQGARYSVSLPATAHDDRKGGVSGEALTDHSYVLSLPGPEMVTFRPEVQNRPLTGAFVAPAKTATAAPPPAGSPAANADLLFPNLSGADQRESVRRLQQAILFLAPLVSDTPDSILGTGEDNGVPATQTMQALELIRDKCGVKDRSLDQVASLLVTASSSGVIADSLLQPHLTDSGVAVGAEFQGYRGARAFHQVQIMNPETRPALRSASLNAISDLDQAAVPYGHSSIADELTDGQRQRLLALLPNPELANPPTPAAAPASVTSHP